MSPSLHRKTYSFVAFGCQRVNMASNGEVGGESTEADVKLLNNQDNNMTDTQNPALVGADGEGDTKQKKNALPLPQTALEKRFFTHFMNPMLAKMEDNMRKNTELLDDLNRKMEEERANRRKKMLSKHIPEILQGNGRELSEVMKELQDLIVYNNLPDTDVTADINAQLRELDAIGDVAVLGHSISAYVSTFEPDHLKHFSKRILSDTALWMCSLFRFTDGAAYFHEDSHDGLLKICLLALRLRYPRYDTDGYEALYAIPPVIYIAQSTRAGFDHFIASQLGLPHSCISKVPCLTDVGCTEQMDVDELAKLVEGDVAAGRTPLLVVAYAGTHLLGHIDKLDELQKLCKESKMWLHVEGSSLATLALYSVPTSILPAKTGDSMTIDIKSWCGIPAVPCVTLYKCSDPSDAQVAGLTSSGSQYRLRATPLWICLQSLGHEGIVNRIASSIELAKMVHDKIEKIDSIKKVVVFELDSPVVVFRYVSTQSDGPDSVDAAGNAVEKNETEEEKEEKLRYLDALNIWLCETLRRTIPKMHVSSVQVPNEGVCLRFAPMESSHAFATGKEEVDMFLSTLDKQLTILDATIKQRQDFQDIVKAQDNLQLIHLPNWAGLGAIQYIPEMWLEKAEELTEEAKADICAFHSSLICHLKNADTAFSLGHTEDRTACIRFGLITEETDLEELIGLVYTTGKEVEESSKFLTEMGDVIRQGIEKANEDLEKEELHKIQEEGVLRQVPLVGSLLNWWSPIDSELRVKGRSLNLASGVLESTAATYECHMQIQEDTPSPASSSSQPRKSSLKPRRSRMNSTAESVASDVIDNAEKTEVVVADTANRADTDSNADTSVTTEDTDAAK